MSNLGPPEAFPRACCLTFLVSITVWMILVAGVTWLIIR